MAEPLIRYKDVEVHQQDLCVLNEVNLELQKAFRFQCDIFCRREGNTATVHHNFVLILVGQLDMLVHQLTFSFLVHD